jgi:transcriptional regulator with PAS, ATPase and Fis domain
MTGRRYTHERSDESLFNLILSHRDVVVLEHGEQANEFHVLGEPPEWWSRCFGQASGEGFDPARWSPFLQDYLAGIRAVWGQGCGVIEKSGPWTEPDRMGGMMTLEAAALSIGPKQVLLIERLGADFEHMRDILQRARERALAEGLLVKSHRRSERRLEASERAKDDMSALLQHLDLAALMLDEHGMVTFVSERTLEMLGIASEDLMGRRWEQALPLLPHDRVVLGAMIGAQPGRLTAVSVHLDGPRPCWLELEVHDDPRHTGRRIVMLRDNTEIHDLRRQLEEHATFHDLVGKSPGMLRVYQLVRDVARVDATVLIEGDTGTGKELVARAIHFSSGRKHKPFIAANCAGLTDSLLASQLFGHKRGAFTGAIDDQQGLFEAAEGGTLFLDEIGDIPPNVQTALLRVLQEKEITRLGEAKPRKVNVRVVAATHHNLSEDVVRGTFRADLLYRIRVARISLPSLRDRREDIPLLARSFLEHISAATGKSIDRLSPDALRLLMNYGWPGNVRELKSALEFAVIGCKGRDIDPTDLPPEIAGAPAGTPVFVPVRPSPQDEKSRLLAALADTKGNRTEAAKRLGLSRATFYRRLVELQIDPRS